MLPAQPMPPFAHSPRPWHWYSLHDPTPFKSYWQSLLMKALVLALQLWVMQTEPSAASPICSIMVIVIRVSAGSKLCFRTSFQMLQAPWLLPVCITDPTHHPAKPPFLWKHCFPFLPRIENKGTCSPPPRLEGEDFSKSLPPCPFLFGSNPEEGKRNVQSYEMAMKGWFTPNGWEKTTVFSDQVLPAQETSVGAGTSAIYTQEARARTKSTVGPSIQRRKWTTRIKDSKCPLALCQSPCH